MLIPYVHVLAVIRHGVVLTACTVSAVRHNWQSVINERRMRTDAYKNVFLTCTHKNAHSLCPFKTLFCSQLIGITGTRWNKFAAVAIMYSFYEVLSVLLPSINGRWPSFIPQWGPCPGLYDVRSRCHSTQRAADEIIRRPNELKEDLFMPSFQWTTCCCCAKAFYISIL